MATSGPKQTEFNAHVNEVLLSADQRIKDKELRKYTYDHKSEPGTEGFAQRVDHTILKTDATEDAVIQVCAEAKKFGFKSVCIRPEYVKLVAEQLQGTKILVCSVICFPEGTQTTGEKVSEAQKALRDGAHELDFVINYPLLQSKDYDAVSDELAALVKAASFSQADIAGMPESKSEASGLEGQAPTLKIILETSQLEREDVAAACVLAERAGFHYVKTSTGFKGAGAKVGHVRLMRELCEMNGGRMKVKASGGIRTAEDAKTMLDAGADRLGLSGSVAIMEEGKEQGAGDKKEKANGDGGY